MAPQKDFFTASLVLADIRGFSSLANDDLLDCFFEEFHPRLCQLISNHMPLRSNSWGSAILSAFDDPVSAAYCALDMRDFFQGYTWDNSALPRLDLRISLHGSRGLWSPSALGNEEGFMGAQIDLAEGLDPGLRAGEVWTSDTFIRLLQDAGPDDLATDRIGEKPIARKWGGTEIYRLRRSVEEPLEDKNIYEQTATDGVDPIAILIRLYDRGDEEQRLNAVNMLGKKNDSRAVEKLCFIAESGSVSLQLRLGAIVSLGEQKNPAALPTLDVILKSGENDDPRIQIAALNTISAIGDFQGGDSLLYVLHNRKRYQEAVALRAVELLAVFRFRPALSYLNEQLSQNQLQGEVLIATLYLLITVEELSAASSVVPLLDRNTQADIRCAAMTYLVYGRPQMISDQLGETACDQDETLDLRILALAGLAKIDSSESRATLVAVAEAAEPLSSYAAQFLIEGKDYVEKVARELRQDFVEKLCPLPTGQEQVELIKTTTGKKNG